MRVAPICVLLAHLPLAATATADRLIVLNKSAQEAALVDPASLIVVARIRTGEGPHEVAVSPDHRRAYVANYGVTAVFRPGEPRRNEPGRTITVIDLVGVGVVRTFTLDPHTMPHGIWTSRDGALLWVTCEGTQAVLELDAETGKILRTWTTGQETSHMLVPTPDEAKLYVANIRSGSVTVIERASNTVKTLVTGAGAEGIDISPDGREVWVTNRSDNTISIIDVASDSVVASLPSVDQMPIRAKFTPDGKRLLVSNARSNSLSIFDVAKRKRTSRIKVGAVPVGIQIVPGGDVAFVACTNDDRVKRIDLVKRRVTDTFYTGNEPDGMAWAKLK